MTSDARLTSVGAFTALMLSMLDMDLRMAIHEHLCYNGVAFHGATSVPSFRSHSYLSGLLQIDR